mmetsp:Transcript_54056/g.166305  ORF Transcript_54056/g.166305 Transcript_54056/m.166305 type:complete len:270 (+) Transcript_54056:298-1107(+)
MTRRRTWRRASRCKRGASCARALRGPCAARRLRRRRRSAAPVPASRSPPPTHHPRSRCARRRRWRCPRRGSADSTTTIAAGCGSCGRRRTPRSRRCSLGPRASGSIAGCRPLSAFRARRRAARAPPRWHPVRRLPRGWRRGAREGRSAGRRSRARRARRRRCRPPWPARSRVGAQAGCSTCQGPAPRGGAPRRAPPSNPSKKSASRQRTASSSARRRRWRRRSIRPGNHPRRARRGRCATQAPPESRLSRSAWRAWPTGCEAAWRCWRP